jgi:hypothetical protein
VQPRVINNQLVFQPKDLAQARQARTCLPGIRFKESPVGVLGAVPLTLETARVLRNLGIEAPSPIEHCYNWPIIPGRKPRPHQIKTSAHFTLNPRAHCHNDPRTGKTLSTLWSIDYLQRIGARSRALVVAPLSTLERAWGDELFLNFPGKRFAVLHGSAEKRKKLLDTDQDVYVINHDGVEIILKELMKRGDIDLIVIDELAVFRNAKTNRWKALNALVNTRGINTWCWGLTGTPTSNEPTDAYGQAKLIRPESVKGVSFTAFKDLTMQQFGPFRWVPRKGSEEQVARVLSPTIRFPRTVVTDMEPCLIERHAELSAEQKHHITKLLREAVTEVNGATVSAVNAAVLLSKVVQAACICVDTLVLSSRGWVPIQEVGIYDLLWDGVEWVSHQGIIYQGVQGVIECGGVGMTPDHEVLTSAGWKTAEDMVYGDASKRPDWVEVRLPGSSVASGIDAAGRWEAAKSHVALPLRLRERSSACQPESAVEVPTERAALWMQDSRSVQNTRHVEDTTVHNLDTCDPKMHVARVQRLPKLWSARYHGLRKMARIIREFLGRYVPWVRTTFNFGADRQRRPLQSRELSLGNPPRAGQQPQDEPIAGYPQGGNDRSTGGTSVWSEQSSIVSAAQERVECRTRARVFDIKNCGPRRRFVVMGANGELRIVHNCGAVLDSEGRLARMDFGPRLKVLEEAIEENSTGKVIVFLPFTGPLNIVANELRKKWTVEVVDGSVATGKRNQIFKDFQTKKDPHLMVAHPACMAHGIELTAADLIIWYAPYTSNEIYTQACCRIDGGGQKSKMDILHISSTPAERRIYATVREKGRLQDCVKDLLAGGKNNK